MHRQVAGPLAFENPAGVYAGPAIGFLDAAAVADQAAGIGELVVLVNRGHPIAQREFGEQLLQMIEKGAHMSQSVRVDVLIIGAGIMGASCAYRLSERGMSVAVLEAQTSPAMGSTGYSVAGVRVQFTEEVNIRISWESIQEYQHFSDLYGEDAGYRPIGYLLLVPPERWTAHMESVRLQQHIGVPVNVLSVEEAQRLRQYFSF